MWQEYRVFGLTTAGEDPEEGEREKTEKVNKMEVIKPVYQVCHLLNSA